VIAPLVVLSAVLQGDLIHRGAHPDAGSVVFVWLIGVPICAWTFVIFPLTLLAQAAMAFVASAMAARPENRDTQIVEFIGSSRYRMMEARIDTPPMRVLTAISAVGTIPGWVFAISAMVITAGLGVVVSVPGAFAALAGAFLVTVGAIGAVMGIRDRVNDELRKPMPGMNDKNGLTEKYYKGLRYRENKRARDLQKARDAGRAQTTGIASERTDAVERWAAAEAEHALRTHGMAAYNARKGVPGALDAAFDDVFTAMDGRLTRAQAEQYVIDAAAYRGKKPVPVRATRYPDTHV
jgi:hypothetical protein